MPHGIRVGEIPLTAANGTTLLLARTIQFADLQRDVTSGHASARSSRPSRILDGRRRLAASARRPGGHFRRPAAEFSSRMVLAQAIFAPTLAVGKPPPEQSEHRMLTRPP